MRFLLAFLFLFAWGSVASTLHAQATIEGVVALPPPSKIYGFKQRYATGADVPTAPTNPPAAVVYLEGTFAAVEKEAVQKPAVMEQKNLAFLPDLVAIPVGGKVVFPNRDDLYHNVFSYSKTKRFDLGRFRQEEKAVPVVFDKPGVAAIHCEIHDSMRATVLVLESPYFVKTDTSGHYRLDHLPVGRYTLKAWVDRNDLRQLPVELKDGVLLHIDFPAR